MKQRIQQKDDTIDRVGMAHFEEAMRKVRPSVAPKDRERYRLFKSIYTKCDTEQMEG